MKSAVSKAKQLATEQGIDLGDNPLSSLQGLHYMKMALDDALNVGQKQGIGNVEKAAITGTREKLIDEIGKIAPDYLKAKDAYAAASQPISQMGVLQELLKRGSSALPDQAGNPTITPARFANATRSLDDITAKVTGRKGSLASKVLTSDQLGRVQAVTNDLSRQNVADTAGKAIGSNTVQNLASQNLLSQITKGAGLPGLAENSTLGRLVRPVDAAYKLFGVPDEIKAKLSEALLDPTSPQSQKILQSIPKLMRPTIESQLGPIFGTVGQASGVGTLRAHQSNDKK